MNMEKQSSFVQGSLFEENYPIRILESRAYKTDITLTEIVVNA
jgi:hypothetical protein